MSSSSDGTKRVTLEDGPRPAGPPDRCFYCTRSVGEWHTFECVCNTRTVRLRAIIEYEEELPASWDDATILFCRNDGSWCANNLIPILAEQHPEDGDEDCLCATTRIELARPTGQIIDVGPAALEISGLGGVR